MFALSVYPLPTPTSFDLTKPTPSRTDIPYMTLGSGTARGETTPYLEEKTMENIYSFPSQSMSESDSLFVEQFSSQVEASPKQPLATLDVNKSQEDQLVGGVISSTEHDIFEQGSELFSGGPYGDRAGSKSVCDHHCKIDERKKS
ncbi:hypothetical protein PNOK_0816100 [Pyrrhoderma noxium]|uniref:Uncharacterized protein n=1 Tax=Pyrrhoderma noxium TaxID=2282107 RepID=A0A286UAD4_9AGAM|nr:hypothetical protein PNOK_0816100 [Pyrrhoderma noxium]